MLSSLYLLRFNNYYNRILKRYDSITEYEPYMLGSAINGINFIPNDGIHTKQVINWDYEIPDYLLVVQDNRIISRWFVIESRRTLAGQFELELFRDCLADYLEDIQQAPLFVEKGMLSDTDSGIFNSENMTYNQIKKSDTLLKDGTGVGWIVGYMSRKDPTTDDATASSAADRTVFIPSKTANNTSDYKTIADSTTWGWFNTTKSVLRHATLYVSTYRRNNLVWWKNNVGFRPKEPVVNDIELTTEEFPGLPTKYIYMTKGGFDNLGYFQQGINILGNSLAQFSDVSTASFNNTVATSYGLLTDDSTVPSVGSKYYFADLGEYYQVTAVNYGLDKFGEWQDLVAETPLHNIASNALIRAKQRNLTNLTSYWNNLLEYSDADLKELQYGIRVSTYNISVTLERVPTEVIGFTLDSSADRRHLSDAPYDMFCIPYGNDFQVRRTGRWRRPMSPTVAFDIAQQMATKYMSSTNKFIYDIQLLPYCPLLEYATIQYNSEFKRNEIILDNLIEGTDYRMIGTGSVEGGIFTPDLTTSSNFESIIFYCSSSSFGTRINVTDPSALTNTKIKSEVELYRLASPNYNGVFEFNAAKNGGISAINVRCTYKPYQPYIYLAPEYGRLYGQTFTKESRGLICGGDYSMPVATDAWEAYQLENKNYQNIFNRQIENMEVKNDVQRTQEMYGMITGVGKGMISGAVAGASKGGAWGAVAGAAVGGVTSGFAGALDIQLSERLRHEAMDYTTDLYGYRLQNIQALPYGLARTSAFDINNKIFPSLEYYCASDEEIQALTEKIKNNGMTIMRIGYLSDFSTYKPDIFSITHQDNKYVYIKGKIIRLDNIADDFHVANVISGELNKGVFI